MLSGAHRLHTLEYEQKDRLSGGLPEIQFGVFDLGSSFLLPAPAEQA